MDKNNESKYNEKKEKKGVVYYMSTVTNQLPLENNVHNLPKQIEDVNELFKINASVDFAGKTFAELYKEGK